jgi:hypothetical protein
VYALGGYPARRGGFVAYDLDRGTGARGVIDPPEPPEFKENDHFHIVAALNGKLHTVGGLDSADFRPTQRHHVFDGERWSSAAPPPSPVWAKFSVVQAHGDSLFVFEGAQGLRYDAKTDTWTKIAPLNAILVMPASEVIDGKIVVLGGRDIDSKPAPVYVYDIAADRWENVPVPAPEAR